MVVHPKEEAAVEHFLEVAEEEQLQTEEAVADSLMFLQIVEEEHRAQYRSVQEER